MAAFDTTRPTYGTTGLIGRIGTIYTTFVATLVQWNDTRITRNSLSVLTDRELTDIGLCRGDIEVIATSKPLI
ncbi:MAG: hypothetical protein COB16_05540 [Rhodobacteraceae bacterium]|nr:MAG: hypothetical protein COB16_05540 [Paracoccaceae bacterium]